MKIIMKKISYPWKRLSPENLKVAQRIINITIDLLQMYSKRTLNGIRLPIQKYSDNGLNFEDIESVLGKINGTNINNARILNSVKDLTHIGSFQIVPLYNPFPSEEELKNYLFLEIDSINELSKIKKIIDKALENSEETTQNKYNINFDPQNGILRFAGKEIIISKTKNSDPYYLLKTLFGDQNKLWNNDEILDDWSGFGLEITDNPKNKVYQAGRNINKIIATKTTIDDFLNVTTKTIQINKKYLQ